MDKCPRCGAQAVFAGYEDARTYYQCEKCKRVWTTEVTEPPPAPEREPALRVLVADDSDELAGLVAMWLRDEGYSVATATSGRQALDVAAVHRPEVALLDVVMPPPDGIEVCEALQRGAPAPEVILMTGVSDPVRLQRAGDLCIAGLLRKPLTSESVLAAVAAAAKKYRAVDRVSSSGT
jgi:two-component system OmpR family response regulator